MQEVDETNTDANNADGIVLLANALTQAESLLHRLEQAAEGIVVHLNADKTKRYNKKKENFSAVNGCSLKSDDKFNYFGRSDSSTENDINIRLTNAWTAIDELSIIWKSDLSDKIKRNFFQAVVVSILLYGCSNMNVDKAYIEKARGEMRKKANKLY